MNKKKGYLYLFIRRKRKRKNNIKNILKRNRSYSRNSYATFKTVEYKILVNWNYYSL